MASNLLSSMNSTTPSPPRTAPPPSGQQVGGMHPIGMLSLFSIVSMVTLPSRMGTEQFLFSCLVTVSSIIFEDANADVDAKWALKACTFVEATVFEFFFPFLSVNGPLHS